MTTVHDFYPQHEAIRLAAERTGVSVRKIPLFNSFDTISEDGIAERVRNAIRPNTRTLGITWVHSASGVKLAIRRIAEGSRRPTGAGTKTIASYSSSTGCIALASRTTP